MWEKLFNHASIAGGVVGGFLCQMLGGYDQILQALIALVILDYITGVLKALKTKTLSSQIGFEGLLRKVVIFLVVATGVVCQGIVGDAVPLREIVIIFFACNEAISLLENASEFVPIPTKLKDTLIQLREKNGGSND